MKLTKLQRYTAYCILLEEAENPSLFTHPYYKDGVFRRSDENGLCWMWTMVFGDESLYWFHEMLTPELYEISKDYGFYYLMFNNWEERKEALKQCIIETHP